MKKILLFLILIFGFLNTNAEDGYRLWLRYELIQNTQVLNEYKQLIKGIVFEGDSPTINAAKDELQKGLKGLLGIAFNYSNQVEDNFIAAGTPEHSPLINSFDIKDKLKNLGDEGYVIINMPVNGKNVFVISANKDIGVMYGVFNFLRLLQTNRKIENIYVESYPKIKIRMLDHWDNLDGTIERGYAGFSLWDWHKLPD